MGTGQTFAAAGMPFLLAGAPALSDAWFSEDYRAIATAIGGLASIIGTVVASVLAPGFFPVTPTPVVINSTTLPVLKGGLSSFMLVQAVLATLPSLAIFVFFRSRPPTPPSASAEKAVEKEELVRAGRWNGGTGNTVSSPIAVLQGTLGAALGNSHFVLLLLAFGCGYGSLNALTTVINQVLQPLGYSDDDVGNIGAALGTGVVGSFVFGAVADYTKRFKSVVKFCVVVAGGGFVWFALLLYGGVDTTSDSAAIAHHPWALFAALGIVGFFGVPLVPLLLELGVETLFPAPEAVVGALLWVAANAFGMCATLISTSLQQCGSGSGSAAAAPPEQSPGDCSNPLSMLHAIIFLGSMLAVSVAAAIAFRGEMKRMEYEAKQKEALLSAA